MKDRLEPFKNNHSFKTLNNEEQAFLADKAELYKMTFQDLKILIDINLDLTTWDEGTLKDLWVEPTDNKLKGKQLKQWVLTDIKSRWNLLKSRVKDYSSFTGNSNEIQPIKYVTTENSDTVLGSCPVASEKTRCCNLLTLDVVNNCGFDCTYCSIQSFFDGNRVYFQKNLKEKLDSLELDPDKKYHIGTGQSSDSLMWGNHMGILDDISDFAVKNPNVILELKTKSKNVGWFLENEVPPNIIITWSLNTDTIIENEEHLTADLTERLLSARKVADKGIKTGFHFHPLVYYRGWEGEYSEMFRKLQSMFKPDETALI
ncbi:MAG: DNA photolyase, partial [Proteobacteria bacterium]|nr:DNA photolyase [Pseudomonadota bacterium]